jgi:hypothetical protein
LPLRFISDVLKIPGIHTTDIDTARRVGNITKEKKQAMLIRLHEMDYVDLILNNKTTLKGSNLVIYEDGSYKNRTLVTALKKDTRVHSAWLAYGSVWAKKTVKGKKFKVHFLDNLDALLA